MEFKGSYKENVIYSVGDVVVWTDNVAYHKHTEGPAGKAPGDPLYWSRLDQDLGEAVKLILDAVNLAVNEVTGKVANNLTTTASGKILDARQGKALKDAIDGVNPDAKTLVLQSSTAESTKKFNITVDDTGELTVTERP